MPAPKMAILHISGALLCFGSHIGKGGVGGLVQHCVALVFNQCRRWRAEMKTRLGRNPQALRKLSPDLLTKAREDDTAAQINPILLTFVGAAVFCVLSLLTPDSALLEGSEKLKAPLT